MSDTATLEPPSTPETAESAKTTIQEAFDRAIPLKTKGETKPAPTPTPAPVPAPAPQPEPDLKPAAELKLPSFLSTEKQAEVKPAEPEIKLEDLPTEAPAGSDEKTKINWKKTRSLLESQEKQLKDLREKQTQKQETGKELSQADTARIKQLEEQNVQYQNQLKAFGLQQDPTFVSQVIQPLRYTYGEAKRIIKDGGGNPEQLDKALMLTGKAHYDAMDEILGELPESAKGELTTTMRDYRRYSQARAEAVANAPKVFDQLQQQNLNNQRQYLESQKGEMEKRFEDRFKFLKDQGIETLMESNDEETKWWNEIPTKVKSIARMIALENQDMDVVMDASILAASAMTYRDLFKKSEERANKAEKELRAIKGAEPRITDAGSQPVNGVVDTKKPFEQVFLQTLKKVSGR